MSQPDRLRLAIQYLNGLQQAGITDLPATSARRLPPIEFEQKTASSSAGETEATQVSEATSKFERRRQTSPEAPPSPPSPSRSTNRIFPSPDPSGYGRPRTESERVEALRVLSEEVAHCTQCPELVQCRRQTVFGVGNPTPRLAFFGEGPGAEEDRQGEPFVGRAGQLLNRMIRACQLRREEVYIFNTIKCRPPQNRNPNETEIDHCWPFAEQQLEILQPEFICCLGAIAARTLLKTRESVGRLRGKFHWFRGSRVVVTYHPAYLLRTPEAKAKTWQDLQMLMTAMGIDIPMAEDRSAEAD